MFYTMELCIYLGVNLEVWYEDLILILDMLLFEVSRKLTIFAWKILEVKIFRYLVDDLVIQL